MVINGIEFSENDVVDVLEVISCYDKSVEVLGYDKDNNEYSAIGFLSCGELVEVDEDTIELIAKGEKK